MKIKSIKLAGFRRFKNLTIEGLPEEARLVVMVGPNGSGKSTIFDALLKLKITRVGNYPKSLNPYYIRLGSLGGRLKEPNVEFHAAGPNTADEWSRSIHVRSAYRNDLIDSPDRFTAQSTPLTQVRRFLRLSENDQAVALNYSRLLNEWIDGSTTRGLTPKEIKELQDKIFGYLGDAIEELFKDPQLTLTGLGSPGKRKIFQFNKGTIHGISYEHLSSGEKAALDLILDIIVFKVEFNDTVFCIDEPEAHIHTKLQGPLLAQLYKLIPDNSQLWIATHSIGMVRKAQDLWRENPDSVVFLDFGKEDLDLDDEATITPDDPNPKLWERIYDIALGDLAELVASELYVFCEGEDFDKTCYQNILGVHYPETRFISMGGKTTVAKVVKELRGKVAKGAKVIGIVDQDNATEGDMERNAKEGIRTLSRKTIENYLLDDESAQEIV